MFHNTHSNSFKLSLLQNKYTRWLVQSVAGLALIQNLKAEPNMNHFGDTHNMELLTDWTTQINTQANAPELFDDELHSEVKDLVEECFAESTLDSFPNFKEHNKREQLIDIFHKLGSGLENYTSIKKRGGDAFGKYRPIQDAYRERNEYLAGLLLEYIKIYNSTFYETKWNVHQFKGSKELIEDYIVMEFIPPVLHDMQKIIQEEHDKHVVKAYSWHKKGPEQYPQDIAFLQQLTKDSTLQKETEKLLKSLGYPKDYEHFLDNSKKYQKYYNDALALEKEFTALPDLQLGLLGAVGSTRGSTAFKDSIANEFAELQQGLGVKWCEGLEWFVNIQKEFVAQTTDPNSIFQQVKKAHQRIEAVQSALEHDRNLVKLKKASGSVMDGYIRSVRNVGGEDNTIFPAIRKKSEDHEATQIYLAERKKSSSFIYHSTLFVNELFNFGVGITAGVGAKFGALIERNTSNQTADDRTRTMDKLQMFNDVTTLETSDLAKESLAKKNEQGEWETNFNSENVTGAVADGIGSLLGIGVLSKANVAAGWAPLTASSLATAQLLLPGNIANGLLDTTKTTSVALLDAVLKTEMSMVANSIFLGNEARMLTGVPFSTLFSTWASGGGKAFVTSVLKGLGKEVIEENVDHFLQESNKFAITFLDNSIYRSELSIAHFKAVTFVTMMAAGGLKGGVSLGTSTQLASTLWNDMKNSDPIYTPVFDESLAHAISVTQTELDIVRAELDRTLSTQISLSDAVRIKDMEDKIRFLEGIQDGKARNPELYDEESLSAMLAPIVETANGTVFREQQMETMMLDDESRLEVVGQYVSSLNLNNPNLSEDTKNEIRDRILEAHYSEPEDHYEDNGAVATQTGTLARLKAKLNIVLPLLENEELQALGLTQADLGTLMRAGLLGKFKVKEYQVRAWDAINGFYQRWLEEMELHEVTPENPYPSSMLLHMATGSGKTYTTFSFIKQLFEARQQNLEAVPFENFKILVLSHTKGITDQLRKDALEGKAGKDPILNGFADKIHAATFHSDSEDTHESGNQYKDEMYFATFQTSGVDGKLPPHFRPTIIVVDEAHHSGAETYANTLAKYYQPIDESGRMPLVIFMTATPNSSLINMVGEPVFSFPLAEYLLDEDAPELNYKLMVLEGVSEQEINRIKIMIADAMKITSYAERKIRKNEIMEYIDVILRRPPSLEKFVDDVLTKTVETPGPTMVFASNIDEANSMARVFEAKRNNNGKTVVLHSKMTKEQKDEALSGYASGKYDIIISVNMLNEGIDVEATTNLVLWRQTQSEKIFFQQLGRGLRGKEVFVYDYAGGIGNMTMMWTLDMEMDEIQQRRSQEQEEFQEGERKTRSSIPLRQLSILGGTSLDFDIIDLFGGLRGLNSAVKLKDDREKKDVQRRSVLPYEGKEYAVISHYSELTNQYIGGTKAIINKLKIWMEKKGYEFFESEKHIFVGGYTPVNLLDLDKWNEFINEEKPQENSKDKRFIKKGESKIIYEGKEYGVVSRSSKLINKYEGEETINKLKAWMEKKGYSFFKSEKYRFVSGYNPVSLFDLEKWNEFVNEEKLKEKSEEKLKEKRPIDGKPKVVYEGKEYLLIYHNNEFFTKYVGNSNDIINKLKAWMEKKGYSFFKSEKYQFVASGHSINLFDLEKWNEFVNEEKLKEKSEEKLKEKRPIDGKPKVVYEGKEYAVISSRSKLINKYTGKEVINKLKAWMEKKGYSFFKSEKYQFVSGPKTIDLLDLEKWNEFVDEGKLKEKPEGRSKEKRPIDNKSKIVYEGKEYVVISHTSELVNQYTGGTKAVMTKLKAWMEEKGHDFFKSEKHQFVGGYTPVSLLDLDKWDEFVRELGLKKKDE